MSGFITRREFNRRVNHLEERMEQLEASQGATQAQVDADTAAIEQVSTDLAASVEVIQRELNDLKNGNPGLDLSKLEAAIKPLDDQAKAVANLKPSQAPLPPAA